MDQVLIIDFGSQVTQLIARRLRERDFFCTVEPYSKITVQFVEDLKPKGIILTGGPDSVLNSQAPKIPYSIFEMGIPILGICYGLQLMTSMLGGVVQSGQKREFGPSVIYKNGYINLLNDLHTVWMSHGDHVTHPPLGFEVLATSQNGVIAVIADNRRKFYGVQFHPEVSHTENGSRFLEKFCIIADVKPTWSMKHFLEYARQDIKNTVGKNKVFCALSGGVDSTVVSVLLSQILGDQVHCIFVNHGLLRDNEPEAIVQFFHNNYPEISFSHVNASEKFFSALKGITAPEDKRKIIGRLFIDIFKEEAKKISPINSNDFLAQGTLYPDIIESTPNTSGSHKIKSHHNVGGLPDVMPWRILEPIKMLFKDEVRHLGHELGLAPSVIHRHPFPGPGLAIRIISEVTEEKCALLRKADNIFLEEIRNDNLYSHIWQAFAILLPIKTVGIMGDTRSYEQVCALRAVTSVDGMTAESYPFKHEFLVRVSNRIINEVNGINRVIYDCTSKPPATIEWE